MFIRPEHFAREIEKNRGKTPNRKHKYALYKPDAVFFFLK